MSRKLRRKRSFQFDWFLFVLIFQPFQRCATPSRRKQCPGIPWSPSCPSRHRPHPRPATRRLQVGCVFCFYFFVYDPINVWRGARWWSHHRWDGEYVYSKVLQPGKWPRTWPFSDPPPPPPPLLHTSHAPSTNCIERIFHVQFPLLSNVHWFDSGALKPDLSLVLSTAKFACHNQREAKHEILLCSRLRQGEYPISHKQPRILSLVLSSIDLLARINH